MTAEQDIKWLMAWWRTNRFKYPRMAKIARRYLSVPASEFGVERRGRDLLGLHRYVLAEIAIGWIFEDVRGVMISSSSIVGFRKEGWVAGVSDGS